ncbi:RNA polymerase sigma-70 factor (ECF subfamily) [Filimonas zeae]|uniref:DNA-directed RNA polymerase sigma-70 factor n=1 Tax=Filimonas zeae TaxID=1737353 RepID=A0A917IVS9_9BACT|nr:sigma-70 family RNA polymerase sigma factor [Filimonas zeae]MDR6338909.1 RNA polymerase sigma-70 factor (ECF subfamily) [Filimonas zeae]GGH66019.1 DNA-directed RNA polymerase sigma-70 factor [Filimonas zeae]
MKGESHYSRDHVPDSEQLLLQQLQGAEAGAYQAFTVFYHQYYQLLYQYVFPFAQRSAADTQEIIQVVFVKLWLKREMLVGIRQFKPYLFRMARNAVMDFYRQRHNRHKYETLSAAAGDAHSHNAEHDMALKEYHQSAQQAINQLPQRRRTIFLLRTADDLSLDEISGQLSLSKDVVKKQLYAAVDAVKKHLHDKNGIIFFLLTVLFCYVAASLW